MTVASGCNHVTFLSDDIDALIKFHGEVFDARVVMDQTEGPLRHVLMDVGGGFLLHPFQFKDGMNPVPPENEMFARGRIDHFAIDLPDAKTFENVRRTLVAMNATNGKVRDFGLVKILSFQDPDGMNVEIALRQDGPGLTLAESTVEEFA